jgi:DNA-binding Lrp family transcriptional regulator
MDIDETDRRILRAIQRNARLTKNEIAEVANTSTSSCWRRIQSLEHEGVIETYEARINPAKVGLTFCAIAMVSLTRHEVSEVENFTKAIKARPEILQVFALTGDADFLLRVAAKDIAHYNMFLNDFLFKQSCVVKVTTNVVMDAIKDSLSLPV